uniref:Uncharacterized protein n=1 Tax=Glossina palpalis gambiensis TaxID=67801 RepID=A0A1B0BCI4_9MUSC
MDLLTIYNNNSRKVDIEMICFNRAAKASSEALLELFNKLKNFNEFTMVRHGLHKAIDSTTTPTIGKRNCRIPGRCSLYRACLDFEQFKLSRSIYINMMCDRVQRVIKWFYYARNGYTNAIERDKDPDKALPPARITRVILNDNHYSSLVITRLVYRAFNLLAAAQIAKGHVERGYAVVGSWEDTNITLGVFENYIPRFFCDAKVIYEMHEEHISNRNRNKRKPQIDDDVKATIRRNFTYEYEFYYFCNQNTISV